MIIWMMSIDVCVDMLKAELVIISKVQVLYSTTLEGSVLYYSRRDLEARSTE